MSKIGSLFNGLYSLLCMLIKLTFKLLTNVALISSLIYLTVKFSKSVFEYIQMSPKCKWKTLISHDFNF